MMGKKIVGWALFVLLFQYVFIYLIADLFSILDDLLLVLVFPFFVFFIRYKNDTLKRSVFVFLITAISLSIIQLDIIAGLLDLIWLLKPIIFFWVCYYILSEMDEHSFDKLFRFLKVVFLVSLAYGVLQFVFWVGFKLKLPLMAMKVMTGVSDVAEGDKFSYLRVPSIYGHPIWFGFVCSSFVIYYFFLKRYVISSFCLLGIILSFSRWPLFLALFGISCLILFNCKSLKCKIGLTSLAIIFVVALLLNFTRIIEYYNLFWGDYSESALKMYGIRKGIELFSMNPLGYGVGSYGTINSVNSYVYDIIYFSPQRLYKLSTTKSGIESIWTILLVQTGIVGFFAYFYSFIRRISIRSKSSILFIILIVLPIISTLYIPSYLLTVAVLIIKMDRIELKGNINDCTK